MAKYIRYQKYQKYYLGQPVDPPEYQKGIQVEIGDFETIEMCQNEYKWVLVPNEYICTLSSDGKTYERYEKLQAYDKKNDTPVDPPIYIAGKLITDGCTEDECNGEPRYQEVYITRYLKDRFPTIAERRGQKKRTCIIM